LILIGWLVLAGHLAHPQFGLVLFLELLMGFSYALVNMNNTRLAMVLAPVMGRSHFFALYSVVANLTLGLAPMFWGLVIDAFGPRQIRWRHFELNRFSLFFGCVVGVFALALVLCRKLDEPKARNLDELITEMLQSPHKLWLRLWPRG
jgi:MFS family permease